MSDDGRFVVFESSATGIVPEDDNTIRDVFVRERLVTAASWSTYGAGAPGKLGVPSLTLSDPPVLNQPTALEVGNSSGLWTIAVLRYGFERDSVPLYGGELLLVPVGSDRAVLPPGSLAIDEFVPPEERSIGIPVVVQVLELDPYAVRGVSISAGLEALPGY